MKIKRHIPLPKKHLAKIQTIERKAYHPLLHKIHKKHHIAKRTLFYMKEYGSKSDIAKTIMKESFKVLIFASALSSLGGLSLEFIKPLFVSIIPLIILLPTLNDMVGDYGIIMSSRFTTMLYEGRVRKSWKGNRELKKLFAQILVIALCTASLSVLGALLMSALTSQGSLSWPLAGKVFLITLIDVAVLVAILFTVSLIGGFYFFGKKEDPNNFLIPLTTSIADFGNMIVLSLLVWWFF